MTRSMLESADYDSGYAKAILDLRNMFEAVNKDSSWGLNSLNKYKNMVVTFLTLLASDSYVRSLFREYGGIFGFANPNVTVYMKPDGNVFAQYNK